MSETDTPFFGNRYVIGSELGRGGMGVVHRAYDRLLGHDVALKGVRLPPSRGMDASYNLAIAREFQVLCGLRHPNIISVIDFGFDANGAPFYTMELVEDATNILLPSRGKPVEERLNYIGQIAEALNYMHSHGIVHRDLKPANVLMDGTRPRILDFGLSFSRRHVFEENLRTIGTPAYLAPELANRQSEPTVRSDLFALGVMACELLTDITFDQNSTAHFQSVEWEFDTGALKSVDIDASRAAQLEDLIKSLTSRQPAKRPNSAKVVVEAVESLLNKQVHFSVWESYIEASRFVGREDEIDTLSDAISRTTQGSGGAVVLSGESGIGKSRLVREMLPIALADGAVVFQGQANVVRSGSYDIWQNVLRNVFIDAGLTDDEAALMQHVVPDLAEILGRKLPEAPVLQPSAAQMQIFAGISDAFAKLSRPAVVILEDLHWAGSESLALLRHIATTAKNTKIMVIGTTRSDERTSLPEELPDVAFMPINRLEDEEVDELIRSMLGRGDPSDDLVDFVVRESEGNIFFLVECMRTLVEQTGALDHVARSTPKGSVTSKRIQAVVDARLSQMDAACHPLIDYAALMGRVLDLKVLAHLSKGQQLDEWIARVSGSALLEPIGDDWQFAHDKFREGLATKVAGSEKSDMHLAIAQAIEAVSPDPNQRSEELMLHYGAAQKAPEELKYAMLAADDAIAHHSTIEAIAYLDRAITLVGELFDGPARDGQELQLQLKRGGLLVATQGFASPVVLNAFTRAQNLCQALGTIPDMAPVNRGLWAFFVVGADLDRGMALAQEVQRLGVELDQKAVENYGRFLVAGTHFWRGELAGLESEMRAFIDNVDRTSGLVFFESTLEDPEVQALSYFAWYLFLIGQPDRADEVSKKAVALAQDIARPDTLAFALGFAGWYAHYKGDFDRAEKLARQSIQLATENHLPYWLGAASILNGGILVKRGRHADGMRAIDMGIGIWRATGSQLFAATFLNVLADAQMEVGDLDTAEAVLNEAWVKLTESGENHNKAEVLRAFGNLALKRGNADAARDYFKQAAQVASDQGALSFELRARRALFEVGASDVSALSDVTAKFDKDLKWHELAEARSFLTQTVPHQAG